MQSAPAAFPFLLCSNSSHSTEKKLSPPLSFVLWCTHGTQTLFLASLDTLDSFNPCSQTNPSGLCGSFSFPPSSLPSRVIPVSGPFPRLLPGEGGRLLRANPPSGAGSPPCRTWSISSWETSRVPPLLPPARGGTGSQAHREPRAPALPAPLQHPPPALPHRPPAREPQGMAGGLCLF